MTGLSGAKLFWLILLFATTLPGCEEAHLVSEAAADPTPNVQVMAIERETAVPTAIPTVTSTPEPLCVASLVTPSQRADHEMVYDQHREKIILFGGRELDFWIPRRPSAASSRHVSETWEYDQCGWKQIDTLHRPPNLDDFDIVYDSVRKVTILFGQYTPLDNPEKGSISMMWEYDGQDWRQMAEIKDLPYPRIFSEMVFNPASNQIVLFGGFSLFGPEWIDWHWETWVLENEKWYDITNEITYESIPPREFPIMAFDEHRNVTVLLISTVNNFTIEFDGTAWDNMQDLPNSGNRPALEFNRDMNMFGGDMVFDTNRGVVVAHGLSGTWEYDGTTWQEIEKAGGPKSQWHAMAYDEAIGVTVLFGGVDENKNPIEGTWLYDGQAWVQD